ncbi:hypothetical protein Psch_00036 [Pelotomaculum schinkii]|uniref:DUF2922 domain-containing protein n=1 Tax=Pelotomaculum schinkii TaxID=78350 RepID=A0A4Y7RBZ6_9FIRM|nr:DUF2922 domain-containing protein [Pelotomaculum schinkii]TEB06504.1 hypothetical protein Psch_00036 [Pelotomaculum schinkii]
MAITTTLRMSFRNQAGKTVSISLDNPKAGLTSAAVEAAMDLMIAKNIFTTSGGDLVSKYDAKLISTDTTDLYNPPA